MDIFKLPGDFRKHKLEYERNKELVSRRYRQQQKESTRQINVLNTHMTNTEVKFKKANNRMEQIEKDINNNFKKHKDDIKEKIEEVNSKIDNLKEDVRHDLENNKIEIQEELARNKMEIQRHVRSELDMSDRALDELEKVTRRQKQKFDNFKQQTNKKFNKMGDRIDEMSRNNSTLMDTIKMMMMCFVGKSRNIDEATNNSINTSEVDTNMVSMSRKMFKTLTTTPKKIKNPNKSYIFSDNENSDLNNNSFKNSNKSYIFSDNENSDLNNSFTAQNFKFSAALHSPKLEPPEEDYKFKSMN